MSGQLREPVFIAGTDLDARRWTEGNAPYLGRRWRTTRDGSEMRGASGGTLVILSSAPASAPELAVVARARGFQVIRGA